MTLFTSATFIPEFTKLVLCPAAVCASIPPLINCACIASACCASIPPLVNSALPLSLVSSNLLAKSSSFLTASALTLVNPPTCAFPKFFRPVSANPLPTIFIPRASKLPEAIPLVILSVLAPILLLAAQSFILLLSLRLAATRPTVPLAAIATPPVAAPRATPPSTAPAFVIPLPISPEYSTASSFAFINKTNRIAKGITTPINFPNNGSLSL